MKTGLKVKNTKSMDVTPHVRRAIALTGAFLPDAEGRLAELIARHGNDGNPVEKIGRAGTKLSRGEMQALGLDPYPPLSHDILALMTPEGRAAPWESLRFVTERAIAWTHAAHHEAQRMDPAALRVYPLARFFAGPEPCEEAWALDHSTMPAAAAPMVPLATCRQSCHCMIEPERTPRKR